MSKKHYVLLRQWKMLQLLPSRFPKDAATIRDELEAEGFKVDLRTVQRDLKELTELFPITAVKGKPIAWRWDRNAMSFDIPGMDSTAALTLRMVDEFMSRLLPGACLESLAPNLRRAKSVLKGLGNESFGGWPDKVRIVQRAQTLQPPEVAPEVLAVINDALFKDRRFKACYRKKGDNEAVEYVVNPLGLVVAEPVIYLVCSLWDYSDIRFLPVHRFESATLIEKRVTKPAGFSLNEYLESGELSFALPGNKTLKLEALFDKSAAAHLYESPLSQNQILTEQGEDVLVQAEVLDTYQLRWWLLGFGDQVEIISPPSLREDFAAIANNMASYYQ